jgi:hypothetical protein
MWVAIIVFFVGVFCGMALTALLTGAETEGESYWRQQYFIEKNKGRSDVI